MILAEVILKKKGSVTKLSLVKLPAVGVDFLKLADEKPLKMAIQEDLQNVTGPVLIADKKYYRKAEFFDMDGEDGYIFFSEETLREVGMDLLRSGNQINLEHKKDVPTEDVELVESWFIETPHDKAYDLGFTVDECPMGKTLMQTQHISDDKLWAKVKDGTYNGFSIQGNPTIRIIAEGIELQKQPTEDEIIQAIVQTVLNYKEV